MSEEDEAAEFRHFSEILDSFRNYKSDSLAELPRQKNTETAIHLNSTFTSAIVQSSGGIFGAEIDPPKPSLDRNICKVRSTLKQFVREWSHDGKPERMTSFTPLIEGLKRHLALGQFVVCPGSGLGRLPYELAKAGYHAQGNEFSYHMILGSHFILNSGKFQTPNSAVLVPYCLSFSNCLSDKSRLRTVRVPDEIPTQTRGRMSMCAGEFVETYSRQEPGMADGLVTCFFIDTAKNIMLYIRTFARMVRKEGIWANLGPLLFHYAENDAEISVELSWVEVRQLICTYFTIEEEQFPVKCHYSGNSESLAHTQYECVFFIAKRNDQPVRGYSNPVFT